MYPESAGKESDHAARESRLFAFGCDSFVHTFTQPDVGLHVP